MVLKVVMWVSVLAQSRMIYGFGLGLVFVLEFLRCMWDLLFEEGCYVESCKFFERLLYVGFLLGGK